MNKKEKYFEALSILDKLKSEHQADINKAELEMNLLAQEKTKHGFMASLTYIRRKVAQSVGLDPKKFYEDFKNEDKY